jgi:para-aminobenzoate synthetase/4-amino-4-deoxychorismate lyase
MKGTAPRGRTASEDDANAAHLAADPKERAENLMIVDLLRNDLSRVARAGSVKVPELFAIERYPTVQQMVSQVEAEMARGRDAIDVVEALFPCRSITGPPNDSAREMIAEVEAGARGRYAGASGGMAPVGSAAFNVAIRTLVLEDGGHEALIGLGSAVVADSTAEAEWRECLAKGSFVTAGGRPFDLIETMRFDPVEGIVALERHIARIAASAAALDFAFDRHAARNELHAATFRLREARRVRLLLSHSGAIAIEVRPLAPAPEGPVAVKLSPLPVDAADFRLRHKTTDRAFHDGARRATGCFETVFVRPDGLLTEGSFTNLFVWRDGKLVTPPLTLGLLPGILRATLIEAGEAIEGALTEADLTRGFFIGNALRGLIAARLA